MQPLTADNSLAGEKLPLEARINNLEQYLNV